MRNRIELLEGASKGIRQAPHRPGREFWIFWLKVQPVDLGQKTLRRIELAFDEGCINDQSCLDVCDLSLPPDLDLAPHGLEIPLDAVHTYRERIKQVEAFRVLGQHGRKHAWDNIAKLGLQPRLATP